MILQTAPKKELGAMMLQTTAKEELDAVILHTAPKKELGAMMLQTTAKEELDAVILQTTPKKELGAVTLQTTPKEELGAVTLQDSKLTYAMRTHTLGTNLFYWNKIDYLVIGDYFSKYLIIRRLPNSSTHAVIKELGLVFTELGRPFVLRSDNGPCYSSREFQNFMNFYQVDHVTSSPHYPQSNGFAEALVGIAKKLMDKSLKEGKPWNFGLLQYRTTPISSTLPSPLEMLTGRKPRLNLPQVPSSIGHNMDTSRIRKELLRRQPAMSTSTGATELEPGQPVFVKEVHGNIWKTATIDQPAAEPDSYWVKFPDNSILRRTRSMIKPRSLPSHFELQAEAQQRNFEGETSSRSHTSFNQLNGQSMLPVTPTTSVTTPATIDRDSQVGAPDPITGATSPTSDRGATPGPQMTTPRCSTGSTRGVPPVCYTPSRK